jgi:ribose/xylose/arabinose/galactoside ABC-type transport system permease subunit
MPEAYTGLGQGKLFSFFPVPVFLFLLVFIAAWFILNKKPFGHFVYAIGNNRDAAEPSGIPAKRILFLLYFATGLLCGIGGVILTARWAGLRSIWGRARLFLHYGGRPGGTSLYGGKGSLPERWRGF